METENILPGQKEPYTSPILSQTNPIHIFPSYKIHLNVIHPAKSILMFFTQLHLGLPSAFWLFQQ
jgi:hypothetical protein